MQGCTVSFSPEFSGISMKVRMKNIRTLGASALGSLALIGNSVYAAVPVEVTTELATMKTDALTVAGLVLVAIIAVVAFKFMRKGF